MKISVHNAEERGLTELGWLHSRHSFSFGNYYNPKRVGFGLLKVVNDDLVEPGKGFGTHFHNNMEIVSIVLEGALEHRDSMGSHGIIKAGEVQRISAGAGISHSEFNHSGKDKVHFLQIWVETKEQNVKPGYEQKSFSKIPKNKLSLIVSGDKQNNLIYIHQDAYFSIGNFEANKEAPYELHSRKNGIFVFVIDGQIEIEKNVLNKGDSAEITEASGIKLKAKKDSQILVVEVPME